MKNAPSKKSKIAKILQYCTVFVVESQENTKKEARVKSASVYYFLSSSLRINIAQVKLKCTSTKWACATIAFGKPLAEAFRMEQVFARATLHAG